MQADSFKLNVGKRTGGRAHCLAAALGAALAVLALAGNARAAEAKLNLATLPPAAAQSVDFTRDIQPLLAGKCFSCHGPEKQRADLRLDRRDAAFRGGESGVVIVPGKSAESMLVRLVGGLVEDKVMPQKGDRLTTEQIGLLRAWIDQGAQWPDSGTAAEDPLKSHWAFRPVARSQPPSVTSPGARLANSIDAFVVAKLKSQGLLRSPEADRVTLIRRLSMVMLGVPPSPEEVRAFVSDPGSSAFDRLVERVLNDPRYGERWGRHWLDVIRFAESNGFETNRERLNAWRFRDYIIAAFNGDKPYDRFIREQIAGDALGVDVATGFLVAGPVDIVGSADPSLTLQQRADDLDDMVNTTGTAFLGLSLGCARCHNHKFDPVTHREYYSLTALFAGVKHGERPQPMPPAQKAELARVDLAISGLGQKLARFLPAAQTNPPGASNFVKSSSLRPAVNARENVEVITPVEAKFVRFTVMASSSSEPCLDELEVWSGGRNVGLAGAGAKATASGTLPGYEIHKLSHINDGRTGNSRSWISHEVGSGWVQLELAEPARIERIVWGRDREGAFGDRVPVSYRIEVAREPGQWTLAASSDAREPFQPGAKKPAGPVYRFEGWPAAEAEEGRQWLAQLEKTRRQREAVAQPPMVYAGSFSQPGPTHRLHRGDPMQKRESVAPGTLAIFQPFDLPADVPEQQRRVKLAEWVANAENPLTARVLVNRVWQHHFGVGLVDTPNDFGRNGSPPSHPELLDWLARDFMEQGWSIKALQRRILLSATWRQSSTPRAEAIQVDAASRLLWRFPPRRLEAEAIRDGILSVSGTLDARMGGPSFYLHDVDRENVYHYQPKEEFGPAENRRMIYAFKVRMEQDGVFGAFDCPDGSLVVPRRSVSTTPLQALNLYNSKFILQQSGKFAARLEREASQETAARIRGAWQLAYNRDPAPAEAAEAAAFAREQGLPALCRAVLNSNEFLFIP